MKKPILLACFFLTFTPFACKKKDDPKPTPAPTKTEIMASKTWKIKYVTLAGQNVTSQYIESCELDDTYKYTTDGKYTYNDAGVKCNPAGDDTGTWSLAKNDLEYIEDGETYKVEELTSTTFRISYLESGLNVEMSYTAQ